MHSGPFGCLTKLGAKRAELVQKFVPRGRVGVFFTTNAPDPPHWTLNRCFGVFRTIWLHLGLFACVMNLGAKRVELVQNFVLRSRVRIFRNERTRSTPLDPKLIFWCVSYYLGAFGTICCLTKLGAKWAKIVQKFVPRRGVGIFRNERIRPTPLDPKLLFWCVSYYLGAFGNRLVALRNSVQNLTN